jgi:hypothetical protein
LKINNYASVSKHLDENESGQLMEIKCDFSDEIVRKDRATAEATSLKGPTSVKDHDASAVHLVNQHKTLKKNIGIL